MIGIEINRKPVSMQDLEERCVRFFAIGATRLSTLRGTDRCDTETSLR